MFENADDERQRYNRACAVTRAGSAKAVPYLREKLAEFERPGPGANALKANIVRRLLAAHDARDAGVEPEKR